MGASTRPAGYAQAGSSSQRDVTATRSWRPFLGDLIAQDRLKAETRDGELLDRRAVQPTGPAHLQVRLGAIYALERSLAVAIPITTTERA